MIEKSTFRRSFRLEPVDEREQAHYGYGGSVLQQSLRSKIRGSETSVDLRPYSSPVQDQFDTSACTANAVIKAREIMRIRKFGKAAHVDLSRMAPYYIARELMVPCEVDKDEGTYLSLVAEAIRRFGVCEEKLWPFCKENLFASPTWLAMRKARLNAIQGWAKLRSSGNRRVEDVIEVLRAGVPVPYGTRCGSSWFSYKQGDVLRKLRSADYDGWHATVLLGWDNHQGLFIGENSWGPDWGDTFYDEVTGEPRRGFYYIDPEVIASVSDSHDFIVMSDDPEVAL